MLKGHVKIGQDLAFRHQGQDLVDMRIRIDIMKPHPHAEISQFAREVNEFCADGRSPNWLSA